MATNQVSSHDGGVHIYTAFSSGGTSSGDPQVIGTLRSAGAGGAEGQYTNLTGTLLIAVSGGSATIDTAEQIFDHDVRAWGPASTGNVAIAIGDPVYFHTTVSGGITGCYLDRDYENGTLFGFALEPIVSGGTDTIWVRQKG